jgi:branched-chain amino acid transport system substrate-binding protein
MTMFRLMLIAAVAVLSASPAPAADDTLTIGFTVSQTWEAQQRFDRADARLRAVARGGQRGGGIKAGDKTYKVNFVNYDDRSANGRVQQPYTAIINQDKVHFLFSPYLLGPVATAAIVRAVRQDHADHGRSRGRLTNSAIEPVQMYSSADQYLAGAIAAVRSSIPRPRWPWFTRTMHSQGGAAVRPQAGDRGRSENRARRGLQPETTDFGPIINKVVSAKGDICWAEVTIRTAPPWRASSTTRRPASNG